MGAALSYELTVRYAECDMQGIVFNAHYLAYMDMSMTELCKAAFGTYQAMVDRGVDIVVVQAEMGFRAPARFDERLRAEVAVSRFGTTSMTTAHRLSRDGVVLLDGEMHHVFIERASFAKLAIPAWAREGLQPYAVG